MMRFCGVVIMSLCIAAGLPHLVIGSSGSSGRELILPKIKAPPSLSPKEQAKLEKDLSNCRSQTSSLEQRNKTLELASQAEEKKLKATERALQSLQEQVSRIERERDEMAMGQQKEKKEKESLSSRLRKMESELEVLSVGSSPSPIYRDEMTGMEFVYVEGGEFQIGDTFGDGDFDEKPPAHKTHIKGFYMGKYEVTQGEWVKVAGSNPSRFQKGDRYPVEQVSWRDVQKFITKLNGLSKQTYRLPSEAEWEYAASVRRNGKKAKYGTSTGELSRNLANYGTESCCSSDLSDGYEYTAPVGSYPANDRGLHDMSGNVGEWVQNCYHSSYVEVPSDDRSVWKENCDGSFRMDRGGSWFYDPKNLRAANRFWNKPDYAINFIGFRLVIPSSASQGR